MNYRIKEFLDLATDESGLNANLFAELIIKECMTICEDVTERNEPAIACYYSIKEKFGVK